MQTTVFTTADDSIAAKNYSSDMTEAGISIALAANSRLTPFVDVAYVKEETTSAAYNNESLSDEGADLGASAPDGYVTYGGGLMLNLRVRLMVLSLYTRLQTETIIPRLQFLVL